MFWDIPQAILDRMAFLEAVDQRDRQDGTPRSQRLRQVVPETGRFIAFLAATVPPGSWLEIGASGGYSGLWISLAGRIRNQRLITFDVLAEKAAFARESFMAADVSDLVEVVHGDARMALSEYDHVAFCFMDAEKDIYLDCYEQVVPNLTSGGIYVADNAISHQDELQDFFTRVRSDRRVDAFLVPIGKGLMVCRKV